MVDINALLNSISDALVEELVASVKTKLVTRLEEVFAQQLEGKYRILAKEPEGEEPSHTVPPIIPAQPAVTKSQPAVKPPVKPSSKAKPQKPEVIKPVEVVEEPVVLSDMEAAREQASAITLGLIVRNDPVVMTPIHDTLSRVTPNLRKAINQLPAHMRHYVYLRATFELAELSGEDIETLLLSPDPFLFSSDGVAHWSEKHIAIAHKTQEETSTRLRKFVQKFEREDLAKSNNLRKAEEARQKRLATLAEISKRDEEHRELFAQQEIEVPPADLVLYRPKVEKKLRQKVGIIGLIPANVTLIKKEYGLTFDLSIALTEGGCDQIRAVGDNNPVVFLMIKWISHKHSNICTAKDTRKVMGGMTALRMELSAYAQEVYEVKAKKAA